jgi:protein-S-isoprenylcysteine O-methyltransferase Ste14
MADNTDVAAIKFPPPLVFVIGLLLGIAASVFVPTPFVSFPGSVGVGWALIALGILLGLAAGRTFRRAGTNVLPGKPSTRLVVAGPYRFSRNPIYVAMALAYVGIAVLMHSLWTVLLLPVVLVVLHRNAIHPEEVYLERLFGADYVHYKNTVRRWL